jgi:hypothetical protein
LEAFPSARNLDADAVRVEYGVEVGEDFGDAWGEEDKRMRWTYSGGGYPRRAFSMIFVVEYE